MDFFFLERYSIFLIGLGGTLLSCPKYKVVSSLRMKIYIAHAKLETYTNYLSS